MNLRSFVHRLFSYLKPHTAKLLIASLAMILATILETAVPEVIGQSVDALFSNNRTSEQSIFFAVVLFIVLFFAGLFTLISSSASSWVSNKVIMQLRIEMFRKINLLPKDYFDKNSSGELLSKLTFDVEQIAAAASVIWLELMKSLITVLVIIIYLFYKNYQLSIILIFLMPLIYIVVKKSSIRMKKASEKVQKSMGKITHQLNEDISGMSIIKIYGAEESETNKFLDLINRIRLQRFKVDLSSAINSNIVNILLGLALALVVYLSSIHFVMTAGEFMSYFTALGLLIKPSKRLISINKPIQIASAAGDSVFKLLDEKEEQDSNNSTLDKVYGDIAFKKVSFSFDGHKNVLKNINFKIKAGEKVAFIGPTGSGKSTIIELIIKSYLPSDGVIELDGLNIIDINNRSLRKHISIVDQSSILFNGSINENITFGHINFKDKKKITAAAEKANALEFIQKLDQGFEFSIGENGELLSGGQRQRLAIARAIFKDAPIFIFDEATSALDNDTEKYVQEAIDNLNGNKTIIIIAHRLSTIKNVDKIFVMKDGEIIEKGSPQELLNNKSGYYSKLMKN